MPSHLISSHITTSHKVNINVIDILASPSKKEETIIFDQSGAARVSIPQLSVCIILIFCSFSRSHNKPRTKNSYGTIEKLSIRL